jgi:Mg-chelatase subunit ChlD
MKTRVLFQRLPLLVAAICTVLLLGCEQNGRLPSVGTGVDGVVGGDAPTNCVDADLDGFSANCTGTRDCDDNDPEITDECYECATPSEGCACDNEGELAECGHVSSISGDIVSCVVGHRICTGGQWGACDIEGMETRTLSQGGLKTRALADPGACEDEDNACDPYCHDYDGAEPDADEPAVVGDGGGVVLEPIETEVPGSGDPVDLPSSNLLCGDDEQTATRAPLGMFLLTDRSGSLNTERPCTQRRYWEECAWPFCSDRSECIAWGPNAWDNLTNALTGFVGSSDTDSMYAALDFFPTRNSDDQCQADQYTDPNLAVGFGMLPGSNHRSNILTAIQNESPGGGTPMMPAVNGGLLETIGWAQAGADRKGVLILLTDGVPTDCGSCGAKKGKSEKNEAACRMQEVANLAEAYYYSDPSVETFVIGVDVGNGAALGYLDIVARAGSGGRRDAVIVGSGNVNGIVDALNAIRDDILPCEFDVPPPSDGVVDTAETVMKYQPSSGAEQEIAAVATPGDCGTGDGFYLDGGAQTVTLCPATCDMAKADLGATIDIEYSCTEACSSGSTRGEPGRHDLFVMMDRSGSMAEDGGGTGVTLWEAASGVMRHFAKSPESEGMGLGISYFPPPNGCEQCQVCTDTFLGICTDYGPNFWPYCERTRSKSCSPTPRGTVRGSDYRYYSSSNGNLCAANDYVQLDASGRTFTHTKGVPIDVLDGPQGNHSADVYDSLRRMIPSGGTPMRPALEGAIDYAYANQQLGHKSSVLLVTDGEPTTCSSSIANTTTVARNGFDDDDIETFVIGVGKNLTNLNGIARAGSGQRYDAFLVSKGDPTEFIEAMSAIRLMSMNCSFDVPQPDAGVLDIESAEVVLSAGDPTDSIPTSRVANAGQCGNGPAWYYDDPGNPTQITLCPSACNVVREDDEPRVDIVYQCIQPDPEPEIETSYESGTAIFEFRGPDCAHGLGIRWGNLSWRSTTPSDSKITFTVQTGTLNGSSSNPQSLSAEVPLEFTTDRGGNATIPLDRRQLDGERVCAGAPGSCDSVFASASTVDTQVGGMLALRPGEVVVDLTLSKNGLPTSQNYLAVRATLDPDTDQTVSPVLEDWGLQATCVPEF